MSSTMTVDTVKKCSICGESKALTEFHKHKATRDGYRSRCKGCMKAHMAAYYVANREAIAERKRVHYESNREAASERYRAWAESNREAIAKQKRAYYVANREAVAERRRAYHVAHPEVGWASSYRARAKAHGFDPIVEDFTHTDVVNLYGDACVHCGGDFEHLDHFPVPVSKGGAHSLNNVAPSCAACNTSRGNAEPRQKETLF